MQMFYIQLFTRNQLMKLQKSVDLTEKNQYNSYRQKGSFKNKIKVQLN